MPTMHNKQLIEKNGGPYTVLHEIGRGGFGIVYLSQDNNGIQYALKLIGPADKQEFRASFEQEIISTSGLEHPNLLRICDYGEFEFDDQIWLFTVAEYCPDGDYRHTISKYHQNPPSLEIIIRDMRQILQGLDVLHSRIVHRDLKPENVLQVGDILKVADFGLAKFVDAATRTLTFKGAGTPIYMAPEIWLMRSATPATDLYALGVIFFEALAGAPPFPPNDIDMLRHQHLYTPAPRIKSINASIPDLVDGVIKKLLTKDAEQRYQKAVEVLSVLESVFRSAPSNEVAQIATRIRKQHDIAEEESLEKQRRLAAEREERALIDYMEKVVINLTDELIGEVNAHLVETKINTSWNGRDLCYGLGKRILRIHFFEPGELFRNPEVPGRMKVLHERNVIHGGFIEIQESGQDREGWNLVLVKSPESIYGQWLIVETRVSPLTGRRFSYEPAATNASLFADNLACHWMPAMHSFNLKDKSLERSDLLKILDIFIPKA